MNSKLLVLLAAGTTGWLMASAALAAAPAAPATVTVSYGDLDLTKEAGVEQLYARLRRAAKSVCGPDTDIRDLPGTTSRNACIAKALAEAVEATHNDRLSARARMPAASAPARAS